MTGWNVKFVPDCIGPEVDKAVAWKDGEILLLEKRSFLSGRGENDVDFAKKLTSNFDVFVMTAS